MKNIFINSEENQLRAGWRILLFIIIFWPLAAVILLVKPLIGDMTKQEFLSGYSLLIIINLALAASIAVWIARRYIDKKTWVSLGLIWNRDARKDLGFGFLLSGLMAGAILLIMSAIGVVDVTGINWTGGFILQDTLPSTLAVMGITTMGILLLEMILVGYWEELVFRGYIFQNMARGLGMIVSIIISCLIYGIIHHSNPNASLLSSVIIVLFGFLRLYGYLSTGQLWLSMGMHIGWNFFQGPIFGFAASGHQKATLIEHTKVGQPWLHGGDFGPEASLITVPIVLAALLTMRWWAKGRPAIPIKSAPAD